MIFVQRKSGEGDDIIKISHSNSPTTRFRVTYEDETANMTPREMYLTESETLEYIGTVLNGLSLDKDPFHHFQITPPGAPAIQFDIADLQQSSVQQAIYASLQFAMRHWVVQEVPILRRRPVLNPEDSEEEEEMPSPPRRRRRTSSPARDRSVY